MNYEGLIIRPPSEAHSLILQIAVGCSHNQCTFCPAYKKKKFRAKALNEIYRDIDTAAEEYGRDNVRRIFLCDGDPLILPQHDLVSILERLNEIFVKIQRVGIYANAKSVLSKTADELIELKNLKLGILYLGLESGDPVTLQKVKKGATCEQMIEAAERVRAAGIKLSVTILLGLAGRERSRIHAIETMRVLNCMKPQHVGALTLMVVPGTPLFKLLENDEFIMPEPFDLIEELRLMIAETNLSNCLFFSNHASNYLPIKARLPQDKAKVLEEIDHVLKSRDQYSLTPEFLRAL